MITKFLAAGPCKETARLLENELTQHRELLPHTITYDGKRVPMTMERLVKKKKNSTMETIEIHLFFTSRENIRILATIIY